MLNKIFLSLILILTFTIKVSSEEDTRKTFEDRNIKSLCINDFVGQSEEITSKLFNIFVNNISENKSNVVIYPIKERTSKICNYYLEGEITEFSSEVKNITISDFINYTILEQQVKVGLEIKIMNSFSNNIIWKRKFSKYASQSWLNFVHPRIGFNSLVDSFYSPDQINSTIKQRYTEDEFIVLLMSEVSKTLIKNLVKI